MISISKTFNGIIIIVPVIIGAYLSGMVYLSEGSAIPLTVFQIALVVAFFFFCFKKIADRDLSFSFYGLEIEYLLFLSIIFLSLIYSPERAEGLFYVTRYIVLIGLTYIIYNSINTKKELRIVCYAIIGIAVIVAFQNIVNNVLNPEVAAFNYINEGQKIIRARGAEADPNVFASNFFMPIMLLIALMGEAKNFKHRLFLYGLSGIIILSVLLTYSRSSWVAIFIAAMLVMIYQKKYSFLFYSVIVTGLVFLGSDSVRNVVFSVAERVADIFAGTSDDSSRFRLILLETAILMWLDSYTFGVGYQGFSTMFQNYYPPQEVGGVFEPHNEYYTVLAELGLIGFVVFMFLLWKIVKTGWNTLKAYNSQGYSTSISLGLFASFIAYLVFFQFLGGMQLHSILTINIGLLFCASKFVNTEEDSDSALQTEPVA